MKKDEFNLLREFSFLLAIASVFQFYSCVTAETRQPPARDMQEIKKSTSAIDEIKSEKIKLLIKKAMPGLIAGQKAEKKGEEIEVEVSSSWVKEKTMETNRPSASVIALPAKPSSAVLPDKKNEPAKVEAGSIAVQKNVEKYITAVTSKTTAPESKEKVAALSIPVKLKPAEIVLNIENNPVVAENRRAGKPEKAEDISAVNVINGNLPANNRKNMSSAVPAVIGIKEIKKENYGKINSDTKYIVVQPGDTLPLLAEKFYGNKSQWFRIYEINKNEIEKGMLKPGTPLIIP